MRVALAALVSCTATTILAQDEEADEMATLEGFLEVIVTAERIEESILDLPMTITALDSAVLEELVIQDKVDLQGMVPGLQFGDEMDQAGQGTVMRGIGTREGGQTHTDRAVATYIDGAYTVGVYGLLPSGGFDLERIEVARGPQGTLNGRNSIAGSVNIVYKRPTREWDTELMTEFTDVTQRRYNVAFGGPLSDHLSFRVTGGIHSGDGRQENVGIGADYDRPDQTFLAPQLRYTTDRFDMNVRWARTEDNGTPRSLVQLTNMNRTDEMLVPEAWRSESGVASDAEENPWYLYATPNPAIDPTCPVGTPGFDCGDIQNSVALNFTGEQQSKADQLTMYAAYDITNALNLRYSFSDSDITMINIKDADYTTRVAAADDHTLAADGRVPFDDTHYRLPYLYDERSQELLLTSSFDGPFNFIAGVFAYENNLLWDLVRVDQTRTFRFGTADEQAAAASPVFGFLPVANCQEALIGVIEGFGIGTSDPAQAGEWDNLWWYCPEGAEHTETVRFYTGAASETQAAFASATFEFNDQWTVSGGLRHTADEKFQSLEQGGGFALVPIGGVPFGVNFLEGGDADARTWDQTIGHVSLEYTTLANQLVYGRLSTGYRSGAFNQPIPGIDHPYIEEETLVNYEAGMKGLFLEDRLQVAAGFWLQDFDGYQLKGHQVTPIGLQLPAWSTTPLAEYTSNIDDTRIWGVDLEARYYLTERLNLSGFYAWQSSEVGPHSSVIWGHPDAETAEWTYTDFETGEPVTGLYTLPVDMTGNRLPMQPEHKLAATLSYEHPLGGDMGTLHARGTYAFTGSQHANIGNLPSHELPSYSRVDASLAWTSPNEQLSVMLFIQNALDEIGLVEYVPLSNIGGNPALGYLTNPREIGLQLRYRPMR